MNESNPLVNSLSESFLDKVKRFVEKVPFTKDLVSLYFCMVDTQTPVYAKGIVAAALTYFLSPADAIPDIVAAIGFTDDATVIALTLRTLSVHVTREHRQQADAFFAAKSEVGDYQE